MSRRPSTIATLPSPHTFGSEVSVPGSEGEAQMQDARRNEPWPA